MKRIGIFRWILGYYELEIPLGFCEDFLNLCLRYDFDYWGLQKNEEEKRVKICVSSLQKSRIITACRIWQIRVKVVCRRGLPEHLSHYKGRWGLLAGAVISLALFILAQNVIWRVDVIGNKRLDKQEIIQSIAENGMSVGDFVFLLNTDSIEQRVMINNDDIAWMSINIVGTVARVEVREVIDTEIKVPNTNPANLVSLFDAQIVGMEVYSGFLSVKEGDYVKAGQLLVSGIHKEGKAPLRITRASGRILGKVSHTIEVEILLNQTKKVPTGEKITKKTLNFFGKSINFFSNYRNLPISYDIINYVCTFNPFSFGELPISLSVDEYYAYKTMDVEISESEAIEQAYEVLRQRIDEELPDAVILKKSLHGEIVDGKYVLKCTLTAICDIAKQVEFEVRR